MTKTKKPVRFVSLKERQAFGRNRRNLLRRMDQAVWTRALEPAEMLSLLLAVNQGRPKDLLAIKWQRMDASPFSFFRGSAALMAADLSRTQVTGLHVQMCGDAHVVNLGAYAGVDGRLVFDLNDFDESMLGPWEWDLKRLATSIVLAGRQAGDSKGECRSAAAAAVASYRNAITHFAEMKMMELAKWRIHRQSRNRPVNAVLEKAERATPQVTLKKLTVQAGKQPPHFRQHRPLLYHLPNAQRRDVLSSLVLYRATLGADRQHFFDAFRPVDVVFKVVGTGSVGLLDYVVLQVGNRPDDALFLQVKEESHSCYAPYLKNLVAHSHQGRRVAESQQRIQTVTDPFLGWTTIGKKEFLVRQLADHKAAIDVKALKGSALREYGSVCGEVLAKAHARTGDAAAIAGYCGRSSKLDDAIAKFSLGYAAQTELDYAAFHKAVKSGKLK
jgi:uncharacterized protein (DUF2252 family)